MAVLGNLRVYPLKSFPPLTVQTARLLDSGALEHDRRWALVDAEGRCWNAKRTPAFHGLSAEYSLSTAEITIHDRTGDSVTGSLVESQSRLTEWLEHRLGGPVRVIENLTHGFPDDLDSPGPTLVSQTTLSRVASWFPGLCLEDVRLRFRANLEVDDVEPFWEDRLFGADGEIRRFRIGGIVLGGVNPCQRCVVPSRDPMTGEVLSGFQKIFSQRRASELPPWADTTRFNHFYRLSVNTRLISGAGQTLSVGERLELVS